MISVNQNSNNAPLVPIESFIGERRMGTIMPIIDLPDSISRHEDETFDPILLAEDASASGRFDLRDWLTVSFPEATVLEIGTPVLVSAEEEGAGVDGSVTAVRLRRADGSLDPFWLATYSTKESPALWGSILRARVGDRVDVSQWTVSARGVLWFSDAFLLRREISFVFELFATFDEKDPEETYWLDRVGILNQRSRFGVP